MNFSNLFGWHTLVADSFVDGIELEAVAVDIDLVDIALADGIGIAVGGIVVAVGSGIVAVADSAFVVVLQFIKRNQYFIQVYFLHTFRWSELS